VKVHPKAVRDLFWSQVDRSSVDGCWPWLGATASGGYGSFSAGGLGTAHRFAFEAARGRGSIGDKFVCHRCDNPPCCRPEHLFLGTCADNMRDMVLKGRSNKPHGESHSDAKLNAEQVLAIAFGTDTTIATAAKFGVSAGLVSNIRSGRGWSRVTGIVRPGRRVLSRAA
jgi:hypothetical protein